MEWSNSISYVVSAFFGGGAVGFLLKTYLDHRLTIRRSRLTEKRNFLQKRREASGAVAEILGQWVHSTYLGQQITNEQRWKLQTVYWKNILLLDKKLIDELFPLLACNGDSISTNDMIVRVRQVLLGLDKPDIKAADLNNWLPEKP